MTFSHNDRDLITLDVVQGTTMPELVTEPFQQAGDPTYAVRVPSSAALAGIRDDHPDLLGEVRAWAEADYRSLGELTAHPAGLGAEVRYDPVPDPDDEEEVRFASGAAPVAPPGIGTYSWDYAAGMNLTCTRALGFEHIYTITNDPDSDETRNAIELRARATTSDTGDPLYTLVAYQPDLDQLRQDHPVTAEFVTTLGAVDHHTQGEISATLEATGLPELNNEIGGNPDALQPPPSPSDDPDQVLDADTERAATLETRRAELIDAVQAKEQIIQRSLDRGLNNVAAADSRSKDRYTDQLATIEADLNNLYHTRPDLDPATNPQAGSGPAAGPAPTSPTPGPTGRYSVANPSPYDHIFAAVATPRTLPSDPQDRLEALETLRQDLAAAVEITGYKIEHDHQGEPSLLAEIDSRIHADFRTQLDQVTTELDQLTNPNPGGTDPTDTDPTGPGNAEPDPIEPDPIEADPVKVDNDARMAALREKRRAEMAEIERLYQSGSDLTPDPTPSPAPEPAGSDQTEEALHPGDPGEPGAGNRDQAATEVAPAEHPDQADLNPSPADTPGPGDAEPGNDGPEAQATTSRAATAITAPTLETPDTMQTVDQASDGDLGAPRVEDGPTAHSASVSKAQAAITAPTTAPSPAAGRSEASASTRPQQQSTSMAAEAITRPAGGMTLGATSPTVQPTSHPPRAAER